jgi:hypothetical protein
MRAGCDTHGWRRNEHRVLMEMYEGKRPSGRPRYGGENNIKRDLKIIIGC